MAVRQPADSVQLPCFDKYGDTSYFEHAKWGPNAILGDPVSKGCQPVDSNGLESVRHKRSLHIIRLCSDSLN